LFSGFLSKDAMLEGAFNWAILMQKETGSYLYYSIPAIALLTIFITAYYMIRQMILVFFGTFKLTTFYPQAEMGFEKIHDPGWLMKIPMVVLGILSVWIFFSFDPLNGHHSWVMEKLRRPLVETFLPVWSVVAVSVSAVLIGAFVAWLRFRPSTYIIQHDSESSLFKRLLKNNWYMDKVYQIILVRPGVQLSVWTSSADVKIIDGVLHLFAYTGVLFAYFVSFTDKYLVDGLVSIGAWFSMKTGNFFRSFQQGNLQGYFAYAILIVVFVFVWLLLN
jgi:NADH-quinone oxidoreductase subunit L